MNSDYFVLIGITISFDDSYDWRENGRLQKRLNDLGHETRTLYALFNMHTQFKRIYCLVHTGKTVFFYLFFKNKVGADEKVEI